MAMLSGEMQVPVWLGLVLLVLAVIGGYAVLCVVRDGIAAGWEWLHDRRPTWAIRRWLAYWLTVAVTRDRERAHRAVYGDDEDDPVFYGPHENGCACHECWPEEEPLPPERSWEELTGEQPATCDCLMENSGPRTGGAIRGCPKHDQPVLEGVLWEPPGFARDNPRMYAPAGEWLSATGERLIPAWQSEILAARAWWEELPSGTGFTRAMAARVRELA